MKPCTLFAYYELANIQKRVWGLHVGVNLPATVLFLFACMFLNGVSSVILAGCMISYTFDSSFVRSLSLCMAQRSMNFVLRKLCYRYVCPLLCTLLSRGNACEFFIPGEL